MNRLVLIGNGFDLAHGLKTSYADFIDWYWEECRDRLSEYNSAKFEDGLCVLSAPRGYKWKGYFDFHSDLYELHGKDFYNSLCQNGMLTMSTFLNKICMSIETKNWVDIENEYYKLLEHYSIENYSPKEIESLNKQLRYLQELLTEYLTTINKQDVLVNENIRKKIYAPIKASDIAIEASQTLSEHIEWCNKQDNNVWDMKFAHYGINAITSGGIHDVEDFKKGSLYSDEYPKVYMLPEKIMFLNFNYTKTANAYLRQDSEIFSLNHIHGKLESPESIIFGYGDEFEDRYKKLQNLNDNECLANIKTIRYQESDNYRQVLAFIESAPFQVCIMGHSCGNSDRTLLNTIFEHRNCISIKPYYYQKDDGSDSYIDTVQNISRNFTDMKLMRDRVVNKTYCETLR